MAFNKRVIVTAAGTTALGVGMVIGAATGSLDALAQETPPGMETPARVAQDGDPDARLAQAYESFVAALASELDSDETAIDAAIRTALKQQIAEMAAAGGLDADQAVALQERIDAAEAPLFLGFGGPGGPGRMHGFDGLGGMHHGPRGDWDNHGPKGGFAGEDNETRETPVGIEPPATLPTDDDASSPSAPADETATESTAVS
jgi:hypothetical protein